MEFQWCVFWSQNNSKSIKVESQTALRTLYSTELNSVEQRLLLVFIGNTFYFEPAQERTMQSSNYSLPEALTEM